MLSTKTGGEPQHMTNDSPQKSSHPHLDDNDKANNDAVEDQIPDRLSQLPPPMPSKLSASKVGEVSSSHLSKTQTLPVLQPSTYLSLVKPSSESIAQLHPSGSSGDAGRPVSGSLEASQLLMDATSPRPQSSAKKPRISARKALRHGFE